MADYGLVGVYWDTDYWPNQNEYWPESGTNIPEVSTVTPETRIFRPLFNGRILAPTKVSRIQTIAGDGESRIYKAEKP